MAQRKDKPPAPIVRKTARGLTPTAQFFAEAIINDPLGTEYDLIKRSKRSNPQNALYWQALNLVVKSTMKWPTAEKLHDALKRVCGYVTINYGLDGKEYVTTDSTAFDAMNADEFKAYFDMAMEKLTESVGFDVLGFMDTDATGRYGK